MLKKTTYNLRQEMDIALRNTNDDIDFLTKRDTDKHLMKVLTSVATIH